MDLAIRKPTLSQIHYQNIITSFNLNQLVTFPTRICSTRASILDHVVINDKFGQTSCIPIPCPVIDHEGILVSTNCTPVLNHKHLNITYRSFKHFNEEAFLQDLLNIDWNMLNFINSVDVFWMTFKENFNFICNEHAPLKTIRVRSNKRRSPWLTNEIHYYIHTRNSWYKYAKSTNSTDAWRKYKSLKIKLLVWLIKLRYYIIEINFQHLNLKLFGTLLTF